MVVDGDVGIGAPAVSFLNLGGFAGLLSDGRVARPDTGARLDGVRCVVGDVDVGPSALRIVDLPAARADRELPDASGRLADLARFGMCAANIYRTAARIPAVQASAAPRLNGVDGSAAAGCRHLRGEAVHSGGEPGGDEPVVGVSVGVRRGVRRPVDLSVDQEVDPAHLRLGNARGGNPVDLVRKRRLVVERRGDRELCAVRAGKCR